MTMAEIKRRLSAGLRRAAEAGDKAVGYAPGENGGRPSFSMDDGGTCNMDTPMFVLPRIPEQVVMAAGDAAGVTLHASRDRGTRLFIVMLRWRGQANRRAVQMRAALEVMRTDEDLQGIPGFRAWGWYAMD